MKKSTKATDSVNKESVFQNLSKEERIALTVFFLTPLVALLFLEYANPAGPGLIFYSIRPSCLLRFGVTAFLFYIVMGFLFALTGSMRFSGCFLCIFSIIFSLTNYFTTTFRGIPILASDLTIMGTAMLDEKTLQIELEHPQVQFLQLLALRSFAPIREDAAEILRPEDCNGPFTLETWSEDLVGMKKNPYCWERDNIKLDKVEAVCLESSDEAYERFVKGEVDVMPIPLKGAEKYSAGIQKKVMTGICESLYLDLQTEGPLQCREFRQALNYALNRVEYKENMDSDFLVPNARYVPENGLGILKTYTENYQDLPCTKYGNQKLAEEKLGEALKKMNISGAEDVNIRLLVNDDPWSIQEGTEIKRQWEKKLGISVELETATGDAFWAEKDNGTVTLTGVIAEYADMMAYLQSWNYDYTYGEEGNQSDTVQKCLRDAERQTDEQIRLSTLYKAEKALMEDVPMIPLQLRKESLLLNRNLTGFETSMNLAGGGYEFLYADFK